MKITIKQVSLLLFITFILPYRALYAQIMVVNDPALNKAVTLLKLDMKKDNLDSKIKMAESIAKVAQILNNVKSMVEKVDSFDNAVVTPLRNDYQFIKGLTENAQWSDMWSVGEYVLGESLNPLDYMPSAMNDPVVSKYLDKQLGWSNQDVRQWADDIGYNNSTSRYSRKTYKKLLPSRADIDLFLFTNSDEYDIPNSDYNDYLAYLEALIHEDTDSTKLMATLNSIDSYRKKIDTQEQQVIELKELVKKRRDKGTISSEGYRAIQDVLDNTEEELDNNRRQLNALIGKLNRILVANAKEVANEVANIVLINALDEAGREMRELNNSRNAEMIDILFDKQ